MYRLKLTTTKGEEFLGILVYTREEAKEKLLSLDWLTKTMLPKQGKLEKVIVFDWPEEAKYDKRKNLLLHYKSIEKAWARRGGD